MYAGKGRNKDKCTFTLNIRANSVSRTCRKPTPRSGTSEKQPSATGAPVGQGSLELSTRDLYCIQTIHEQEDIFKLLVSLTINLYSLLQKSNTCIVLECIGCLTLIILCAATNEKNTNSSPISRDRRHYSGKTKTGLLTQPNA